MTFMILLTDFTADMTSVSTANAARLCEAYQHRSRGLWACSAGRPRRHALLAGLGPCRLSHQQCHLAQFCTVSWLFVEMMPSIGDLETQLGTEKVSG